VFLYPPTPLQRQSLIYEYAYLTNYREHVTMGWAWSLCVEEHFYLAVPLLMAGLWLLKSHTSRIVLLVGMWLTGLVVRLLVFYGATEPWHPRAMFYAIYITTHTRFDTLVAGILLAYLQHYFAARIRTALDHRAVRYGILAVVLGCLTLLMSRQQPSQQLVMFLFSWGTLTSVMYLPLILWAIDRDGAVQRWLGSRFFLHAATLGYGIYLWHIPICDKLLVPPGRALILEARVPWQAVWWLTLAALVVLSAIVAYLGHLLVEKPALWLRDRIAP
jgi:peptidoglycan/LPS O-acetylase OafA/YrhL